tara:strand:+ start:193 stop:630 length:438 start_codon:yes stop_codon:yes gene_type:complete
MKNHHIDIDNHNVIIVCSRFNESDTIGIKEALKGCGMKWCRKAKKWFAPIESQARVQAMLEFNNVQHKFYLKTTHRELLFNPGLIIEENDFVSFKALKEKGVSQKIIDLYLKREMLNVIYSLDSIGRKIDKRIPKRQAKQYFGVS